MKSALMGSAAKKPKLRPDEELAWTGFLSAQPDFAGEDHPSQKRAVQFRLSPFRQPKNELAAGSRIAKQNGEAQKKLLGASSA
jgi:hypothetical protein